VTTKTAFDSLVAEARAAHEGQGVRLCRTFDDVAGDTGALLAASPATLTEARVQLTGDEDVVEVVVSTTEGEFEFWLPWKHPAAEFDAAGLADELGIALRPSKREH
jgi:hypothetical protein